MSNIEFTKVEVQKPTSKPYICTIKGEEQLCFRYTTRNTNFNIYTVRFNVKEANISNLSDKFKEDNCVYPKANITKSEYRGNRWDYETDCNKLAWQFVCLNTTLLYGRKGLIQRAVDTYRL